ncbi:beta-glucosidase family protein [Agromyces subbeticus]|uniref:beta-glucosidase family protein n=1 Tax=Agromyces subbeticus TaxID=293890 RepID=UPI0003B3DDBD|nr:glycoside hydrolase family 3 C-terminal domain-containing protein [Agromyces subbeticus]
MTLNHTATETTETVDPVAIARTLPLDEKVRLLTGAGTWTLHSLPELGLRSITVSDGPIGVRGGDDTSNLPSAQLPAPSATAATWDPAIQRRIGALMAAEARRQGVDVVLAPVVNLQRTPVGGRHFECLSEDPTLAANLAVAFVESIQAAGVAACIKHFVANEQETERTEYLARIDERTLREVYLAPFEAVVEAGVWTLMAAYNGLAIDGVEATATEHEVLLTDILRTEWGFDGVVVSDWLATKSTDAPANAGLDLVMPGPLGPWGEALVDAVREGRVSEAAIDDHVARILALAARVGALSGVPGVVEPAAVADAPEPDSPEVRSLLTELAARSTVVLRNEGGLLPLEVPAGASVALIGPNAVVPFTQGGGSAFVTPPLIADPLGALRAALSGATVTLHRGGATEATAPIVPLELLTTPTGEAGLLVELLDVAGHVLERFAIADPARIWFTIDRADAASVRLTTRLELAGVGRHEIEIAPVGAHRVSVEDALVGKSSRTVGAEVVLDSSYANPPAHSVVIDTETDAARTVTITGELQIVDAESYGRFVRLHLRYRAPGKSVAEEIDDAVAAAAAADLAIVVIGTNAETESEGWDRPNLELPGSQNELVRRVAAANARTVVVVNAGAPVILPWLDEVPAVLWWWLPGQEAGTSLAAVLTGEIEPSGRLPWTLPANEADVPVPNGLPSGGYVDYTEGLHVGHRGWDKLGRTPAREFGYGLGYTAWQYDALTVSGSASEAFAEASVTVTNAGERDGREVVQLYVEGPDDGIERPVRWLAGSAVVDVAPGASATVVIALPRRTFEVWDVDHSDWTLPSGAYRLRVGRSSRDLRLEAVLQVPA